jgi:hypothetical protein
VVMQLVQVVRDVVKMQAVPGWMMILAVQVV